MLAYAIIMFLASAPLLWAAAAVYRGRTDLIHAYHQEHVADKAAYGRAFGKALFVVAASPLVSGVIALCGGSHVLAVIAILVLLAGIGTGIGCIVAVQRKYNGGSF